MKIPLKIKTRDSAVISSCLLLKFTCETVFFFAAIVCLRNFPRLQSLLQLSTNQPTNDLTYRHWIFTSTIADYTSYVSYLHKLRFVQRKKWDPQWGSLCYPSCSSSFSFFFCYCWSSILPARNPSFCWRCLRLPLPSSSSGVIKYYYKCWNDRHEY